VQTTLLGLAIALILALVTALVGPYFVNWNEYRGAFEAEASRIVGLKVRVTGDIDARLLPFPSVTLGDIEIGPAGQASRLRARSLGIEFGLGPLLRGELRAVEMRLVAPQIGFGLNSLGQVDWPTMALATETLSIERLRIDDGRLVLTDAASDTRIDIEKLSFAGDVKSLVGPFRGSGTFTAAGVSYGYRASAGRFGDDGIKVKLALDDSERPLNAELEGLLAFERSAPHFEGVIKLLRPAGAVQASGRVIAQEPWRLTGQVKATSQQALIEQVAFQYGPEERAVSLSGTAELRFGEQPRLISALSARQIDLDRLIATPAMPRRPPLAAIQNFAELFSAALKPAMPTRLTVSVDAVTLGGALIQNVGTDLSSDVGGWRIDRLDFRAPGFARINLSGRLERSSVGLGFAGALGVDANDPRSLVAWLAGRGGVPAQIKPLKLSGELALSADCIAIERLQASFDRGTVAGRLSYLWPSAARPARLDAELTAGELDLDALLQFGSSALAGLDLERPRHVALAFDIERARLAGFDARNVRARLAFDDDGIAIERLSVADFGNASIEASGRIATSQRGGNIALDLDARDLRGVIALAEQFTPRLAGPLQRLAGRQNSAKLRVSLGLDNTGPGNAIGKLAVAGRIGAFGVAVNADAAGKPADFAWADLDLAALRDARIEAALHSDDGNALLRLIGLDRMATADVRPARLSVLATGPLGPEIRIDAKLAAGAIDVSGKGRLRLPDAGPVAVALEQLIGQIGGSPLRGNLAVTFADQPQIEGAIEAEAIDAPALIAAALGMPRRGEAAWPAEPFAPSNSNLGGRIELKTPRATISSTLTAKHLRGVLSFSPSQVVFDELAGELAGGRIDGRIAFALGRDGVTTQARIALRDADAATITAGRGVIGGKLTLQADLTGAGLSPAAFIGSIAGNGSLALADARLSGLNPRLFDAVIRAVELGVPTDPGRIREFVLTALDTGDLSVQRVEAAITFKDGRARPGEVTIRGAADLAVTANVDLADATLDAVLTLSGAAGTGAIRPMVFVMLKGPLLKPTRSVEVDALASFLALRAVEQQAKRLDAIERPAERPVEMPAESQVAPPPPADANALPATASLPQDTSFGALPPGASAAPLLPSAITVLPVPRPRPNISAAPQAKPAPQPAARAPAVPSRPLDLLGAQR
jgi:large subunit ribosomal protein L24